MKWRSISLCRGLLIALALALWPAPARAGTATSDRCEPQFLWGFVSPGEDPSEIGKEGVDDVGPPRSVRTKWIRQSGVTYWGVRARWNDTEPQRLPDAAVEADFNWTKFDEELDSIPPGLSARCDFKLDAPWAQELKAKDEEQYWRLAERFIEMAARRAHARGVRYYAVPGNEMSLTGRPDSAELYMGPVRHFARAIHRGHPDSQVIAGALVCGCRDLIDELYKHGFKENCDVLDIHAYASSPGEARYNVGLSQILEAHQALVDHGDGHKRIFLGEGWSVFPLPAHLDKPKGPPVYTADDIQHYRKAVVHGYAALSTPRPGYDPKWLLGARFFCLNDLWGSMGLKKRAIIEYDRNGGPAYWLLDGYRLPYEPGAMDPRFRAWGLIDIEGNPKGDTIRHFPPCIPRSSVWAVLADKPPSPQPSPARGGEGAVGHPNPLPPKGGEGAAGSIFPGVAYRVRVSILNKETDPFDKLRFSMDVFQGAKRKEVQFKDLGTSELAALASDATASRDFELVASPSLAGHELRVQGGCEYDWHGQPYYADGWLKLSIASPGAFEVKPFNAMAAHAGQPVTLVFSLKDLTGARTPVELSIAADDQLAVTQSSQISGENSRAYTVLVSRKNRSAGGFHTLEVSAGKSFQPIKVDIAFPNPGRTPETYSAAGRPIDPGFEEFGPGSGFEGWDGPPSNFDDREMAADLPNHGDRMIATVYNNTKYAAENSQTVLPPAGFAAGKTLTAAVWTKGVAFAGATDHGALRFRISVVFLDAEGKQIRRDDSPFVLGSGKWEKLEFTTGGAPDGACSIRLILVHENTNSEGWHKAALDNVELL